MTTQSQTTKRGWKQLVALKIINEFPDDGLYEDLSAAVAAACFSDEIRAREKKKPLSVEDKEGSSRHLLKYLVKYQITIDDRSGKKQTLQDQGRTIDGYVNSIDDFRMEPDPENPGKTMKVRLKTFPNAGKGRVILQGPTTRKKPVLRTPEQREEEKRGTPARLEAIRAAAKNLRSKKAAEKVKELAEAGAHQFTPEVTEPTSGEVENA